MGLGSKLMLMILVPITIMIGFSVAFSFMSGKLKPFDLFDYVNVIKGDYILIGVFILLGIVFFSFFLFLKEKFLGTS